MPLQFVISKQELLKITQLDA